MKVRDCMSRDVHLARPDDTICDAARAMAEIDAGALPVAEIDRLVGMITDRDIALRAVAQGRGPDTRVDQVMTREVLYCFEDQDTDDVLRNMGDQKVRRLPVVDREKQLIGIVSLSDMTTGGARPPAAEALQQIATPGGPHS
jgi:CBS domain-containing protein